jgi:hypothetical protein
VLARSPVPVLVAPAMSARVRPGELIEVA